MIGQHPELYGVPELNLFMADTLEEMCEKLVGVKQIQLHGLLRTVAQLYSGEQNITSIEMARRWIFRRLAHSTVDVYWELCEKVDPLCIVDKSPIYAASRGYLNRIRRVFPEAYYLHLLRHPRTQGESILNVAGGAMAVLADSIDYSTDPPTVDPQIAWYRIQKNILRFLWGIPPKRKMCMLGEELLNDPNKNLKEICLWLSIRTDQEAIEAMLHPEDSPFACLGPLGANLGNDINFLKAPELKRVEVEGSFLEGPLPWRKDGEGFRWTVLKLAQEMGYH